MTTGPVPLFVMSSRSTILPLGLSLAVGATSGRYVALPLSTCCTLMVTFGADIPLPPFVNSVNHRFRDDIVQQISKFQFPSEEPRALLQKRCRSTEDKESLGLRECGQVKTPGRT